MNQDARRRDLLMSLFPTHPRWTCCLEVVIGGPHESSAAVGRRRYDRGRVAGVSYACFETATVGIRKRGKHLPVKQISLEGLHYPCKQDAISHHKLHNLSVEQEDASLWPLSCLVSGSIGLSLAPLLLLVTAAEHCLVAMWS